VDDGAMRFLARFLALIALAGAFAGAVIDGARWVAAGTWTPTSAGAALYWLSPKAVTNAQSFVESKLGAWAWDNVLVRALLAPAFVDLMILSALLFLVSRRPSPEIGHSARDR
jgi:hypothetical protein